MSTTLGRLSWASTADATATERRQIGSESLTADPFLHLIRLHSNEIRNYAQGWRGDTTDDGSIFDADLRGKVSVGLPRHPWAPLLSFRCIRREQQSYSRSSPVSSFSIASARLATSWVLRRISSASTVERGYVSSTTNFDCPPISRMATLPCGISEFKRSAAS